MSKTTKGGDVGGVEDESQCLQPQSPPSLQQQQQQQQSPQNSPSKKRYSLRERKPTRVFSPPQEPVSPRKSKRLKSVKSTSIPTMDITASFVGTENKSVKNINDNDIFLPIKRTPNRKSPRKAYKVQLPLPPPPPPQVPINTELLPLQSSPDIKPSTNLKPPANTSMEPLSSSLQTTTITLATTNPEYVTAPIFVQSKERSDSSRTTTVKPLQRNKKPQKPATTKNTKSPAKDKTFFVQHNDSQPVTMAIASSSESGSSGTPIVFDDDDDDDFIMLPSKKTPRTDTSATTKKKTTSPQQVSFPPLPLQTPSPQAQQTLLSGSFVVLEHAKTPQKTQKQKEQPSGNTSGKKRQQRQMTLFSESPKASQTFTPKSLDEAREKLLLESMEFNRIVERFTSKSEVNPLFAPPQVSRASSSGSSFTRSSSSIETSSDDSQKTVIDISSDAPIQTFSIAMHIRQVSQDEEDAMMAAPSASASTGRIAFMEPDLSDPGKTPLKPWDYSELDLSDDEDYADTSADAAHFPSDYIARVLQEIHDNRYGKSTDITGPESAGECCCYWAKTEARYAKLKEESGRSGAQHMLWVDKYKPEALDMLCGNERQFGELSKWLANWSLGSDSNAAKPRARSKWEEDEKTQNMCLLQGDFSTCKTAGVYTCAAEREMEVIEINASELRSSKQISKIGEASSTRQFATAQSSATLASFFSQPPKNKKQQKSQASQAEAKRRLFLFEDIDVFFPCDADMHNAILALEQKTSYPIIATCRCK